MEQAGAAIHARMMYRSLLLPAALLIALLNGGCVGAQMQPPPQYSGRGVAEHRCGACHAVAMTDASPNPLAPPLRDLFKRYPIYALDQAFQRGLEIGHQDMPRFTFAAEERAAIIAYLDSLNPCAQPSADDSAMARCFDPM